MRGREGEDLSSSEVICFGLNRASDEQSLAAFLRLFSQEHVTEILIPRLTDEEINRIVELLSTVMRNHLDKQEYHELFLGERRPR